MKNSLAILTPPTVKLKLPPGIITFPVALPIRTTPVPGAIPILVSKTPAAFKSISPPLAINGPDIEVPDVAFPILTRPVPPVPMVVVAFPEALIEVGPTTVVVPVKLIGPGFTVSD